MTATPIKAYNATNGFVNPMQTSPVPLPILPVFSYNNAQPNGNYNFDFEKSSSNYPDENVNYMEQLMQYCGNGMSVSPFDVCGQVQNQILFNKPSLSPNMANFDLTSQLYQNNFLSITRPIQTFDLTSKIKNTDDVYAPTGKKDLAYWKSLGYDEQKGKELAKDAVANCAYKWNHQCARYSRQTLNRVYKLNIVPTKDKPNWGCNFGRNILQRPELKGKFKCIKINGIRPEDIPDGAYLIWPGSAFGKGPAAKYGHVATAYHGKPYSDNVGCNTMKCSEIWIPVKEQA